MEKIVSCLILCSVAALPRTACGAGPAAPADYDRAIAEYVQFLKQQNQTPVDYIMGLFKTYDIVVLCERAHPEITQYEMIGQLAADKRFQQQVGHIFTECDRCTIRPELESSRMDGSLNDEQVKERLLAILRDFNWGVGWGRTNHYGFLKRVHDIDRPLPPEQRIHIYPCDMAVDWHMATRTSYGEMCKQLGKRDKIMADHMSQKFDEIRASANRKKALVIMNYRHAFPHLTIPRGGRTKTFENMTGYLMAAYPGQVANVLINNVRILPGSTDNQAVIGTIQDGKRDAAFAAVGNPNLGFDFRDSPFGADGFDYFAAPFPRRRHVPECLYRPRVFQAARRTQDVLRHPGSGGREICRGNDPTMSDHRRERLRRAHRQRKGAVADGPHLRLREQGTLSQVRIRREDPPVANGTPPPLRVPGGR
jgi:hypothetical protein